MTRRWPTFSWGTPRPRCRLQRKQRYTASLQSTMIHIQVRLESEQAISPAMFLMLSDSLQNYSPHSPGQEPTAAARNSDQAYCLSHLPNRTAD